MSRLIEILNVETSELDKNGRLVFTPPEPAPEPAREAAPDGLLLCPFCGAKARIIEYEGVRKLVKRGKR